MRSTDERVAAIKGRVKELERKKKQRQYCCISLLAATACLALIAVMGVFMPSIMKGLEQGDYTNTGMMASIFYEGGSLGYILVGLLAFALGICLTVLCLLLHRRNKRDMEDVDDA